MSIPATGVMSPAGLTPEQRMAGATGLVSIDDAGVMRDRFGNAASALSVSGVAGVGNVLTASFPAGVGTVKWQRLVSGVWTDIAGATNLTYVQTAFDAPGVRPVSTSYAPFGAATSFTATEIYDIYLLIGQSNNAGRATIEPAIDTVDPKVFQFGSFAGDAATFQKITQAADPLKHPETNGFTKIGPGMSLAKNSALSSGNDVLLVPCAWGATAVVYAPAPWSATATDPGGAPINTTAGSLHWFSIRQAIAAIATAQAVRPGSRLAGIIDIQGEEDGNGVISQAAYMAGKFAQYAGVRASIPGAANVPIIIGQMLPEAISSKPAYAQIDAAHTAIAASVPRATKVTVGTGFVLSDGTGVHYNGLGERGSNGRGGMGLALFNGISTALASAGDTLVPNAPTVAVGTPTSGSVPLTLTAPTGGGTPRYYEFQYATQAAPTVFTAGTPSHSLTGNSLSGLSASTSYIVQARARNAAGSGPWSASASFTTAAAGPVDVNPNLTSITGGFITRSGDAANGYTFTSATGANGNTSYASVSDYKLASASDSTLTAALNAYSTTIYKVLSLQRTNTGKNWSINNSVDYSLVAHPSDGLYRVADGTGTWGYVTLNGNATLPAQSDDIMRWRRTAAGSLIAEVARSATPTAFTVVHTFSGVAGDLFAQISINNTSGSPTTFGPLRMTNAVAA